MGNVPAKVKKQIADLLDDAHVREQMYVDLLMKSATLAAFQVLGKRADWQENPIAKEPESTDLRDYFLDVLIDILVGDVAKKLLQSSVESLLRPIIRSRQAYYVLPGGAKGVSLAQAGVTQITLGVDRDRLSAATKKAKERISKHLTDVANAEEFTAYRLLPEMLAGQATGKATEALKDRTPNLPSDSTPARPGARGEGDVSIVRILTSADEAVAAQSLAVSKLYGELKTGVQYTDIPEELAETWIGFLQANKAEAGDTQARRARVRSYLLLWYEMAMWAHMIQGKGAVRQKDLGKSYGGGQSDQVIRQNLADPNRYKLRKSDGNATIFQVPAVVGSEESFRGRAGAGVVQREYEVQLPKTWLQYWIGLGGLDPELAKRTVPVDVLPRLSDTAVLDPIDVDSRELDPSSCRLNTQERTGVRSSVDLPHHDTVTGSEDVLDFHAKVRQTFV